MQRAADPCTDLTLLVCRRLLWPLCRSQGCSLAARQLDDATPGLQLGQLWHQFMQVHQDCYLHQEAIECVMCSRQEHGAGQACKSVGEVSHTSAPTQGAGGCYPHAAQPVMRQWMCLLHSRHLTRLAVCPGVLLFTGPPGAVTSSGASTLSITASGLHNRGDKSSRKQLHTTELVQLCTIASPGQTARQGTHLLKSMD